VIAHLGDHMARRDEAGRYKQVALGRGAQINNMAPPKYSAGNTAPTVKSVYVLQQGIDSVWFNIYGEINDDFIECLEAAKEDAQAAAGDWALSPLPPFDGTNLRVHASGVKYYQYLCGSDDLTVTIRKPSRSPRPMAVVRISAMALWRMGGGGLNALREAALWLRPVFGDDYRVVPKAVHLATDFQGWAPTLPDLENVVGRAGEDPDFDGSGVGEDDDHLRGYRNRARRLTGLSAGRSNVLRLNMYDKGHQAKKEQKDWVFALWEQCEGYDRNAPTWRVEYQFGRTFLREHGIENIGDMLRALPGLWGEAMRWYSFRLPSVTDSNKSRWPVAPAWSQLSAWGAADTSPLPKVKIVRPRFEHLAKSGLGYLTSIWAVANMDCGPGGHPDPEDIVNMMISAAYRDDEPEPMGRARLAKIVAEKQLRYAGFTMAEA
jgi:hypothetical protein